VAATGGPTKENKRTSPEGHPGGKKTFDPAFSLRIKEQSPEGEKTGLKGQDTKGIGGGEFVY